MLPVHLLDDDSDSPLESYETLDAYGVDEIYDTDDFEDSPKSKTKRSGEEGED